MRSLTLRSLRAATAVAACGVVLTAGSAIAGPAPDPMGPAVRMNGEISPMDAVLYDNTPLAGESVFSTTAVPRTGGADEALFSGPGALITSMQFGYLVDTGGPSAFDARIRIFDDVNLQAGAGTPQFQNQKAEFTLQFTNQTAGAFITAPVSLASLPGGGASVTANPQNLGVADVTDAYVQLDFFQPGTTTPVANNAVTFIFDGSGTNAGFTFASPIVGGSGAIADELYWRDVNSDGVIAGDEARAFATARANFVLRLEGNVIPEPAALGLLSVAGVALLRRRR